MLNLATRVQRDSAAGNDSPHLPRLDCYPVVTLKIGRLSLEGSPRMEGEDLEHARVLAGMLSTLPPILVQRATMRVIDGRHRIRAALLNGRSVIAARLVDCDEKTAFLLAVQTNIAHGLPLSLADRKKAAAGVIRSYPHWSDRAVAQSTGLSDKTVSVIRSGSAADSPQSNARLGKDGRRRPLNSADKRRQAAEMIAENPNASLREIARATGLSASTVRDVRLRTGNGQDPVPARYRQSRQGAAGSGTAGEGTPLQMPPPVASVPAVASVAPVAPVAPVAADRQRQPGRTELVNPRKLLAKLGNDPSLKFSESGRHVIGWLRRYAVDVEGSRLVAGGVPDHWVTSIAELARGCAASWITLAELLEQRYPPASRREGAAPSGADQSSRS